MIRKDDAMTQKSFRDAMLARVDTARDEMVRHLTATFVVAAKMTDEEITHDSRVADGIRAVLDELHV